MGLKSWDTGQQVIMSGWEIATDLRLPVDVLTSRGGSWIQRQTPLGPWLGAQPSGPHYQGGRTVPTPSREIIKMTRNYFCINTSSCFKVMFKVLWFFFIGNLAFYQSLLGFEETVIYKLVSFY